VIRRKVRSKKKQALLVYKQQAAIGIGETQDERRRRKRSALTQQKLDTHDQVWVRDPWCRVTRIASDDDTMHEDPSRAKTRGLPPDQRFNTMICIRLSPVVHEYVQRGKIILTKLDPVRGFDGPIRWTGYGNVPAGYEIESRLVSCG
jgi:hypothetical protein